MPSPTHTAWLATDAPDLPADAAPHEILWRLRQSFDEDAMTSMLDERVRLALSSGLTEEFGSLRYGDDMYWATAQVRAWIKASPLSFVGAEALDYLAGLVLHSWFPRTVGHPRGKVL